MRDIADALEKYIGLKEEDKSTVYTPMNIAVDMVNLLPDEVFKPDTKFIDPACKTGRFLIAIYNRLMKSPYMAFMSEDERSNHIIEKQLYGVALTEFSATIIRKALYNSYKITGNVTYIDEYSNKYSGST